MTSLVLSITNKSRVVFRVAPDLSSWFNQSHGSLITKCEYFLIAINIIPKVVPHMLSIYQKRKVEVRYGMEETRKKN
ncbi:hypothetical protein KY289_030668 [Solanum tuberosum]|nr:hypothetical protein KY289_030668 [Solanum tuberosum]